MARTEKLNNINSTVEYSLNFKRATYLRVIGVFDGNLVIELNRYSFYDIFDKFTKFTRLNRLLY